MSEKNKKSYTVEGITAFIGVSAPETPKFLLANNFLAEYFETSGNEFATVEYNFNYLIDKGTLYIEDEDNREKLKVSFDKFLNCYLGEELFKQENRRLKETRHYYFPFTPNMLTTGNYTLRHLLIYLQNLDESFKYEEIQQELNDFLFNDESGVNHIFKILFQNEVEHVRYRKGVNQIALKNFWNSMNLNNLEYNRMKKLGESLNDDLHTLLTHEYFCKLDFYRKYNYLSILLTSYVILYVVFRRDANMGILCKGNPSDIRLNGLIHRACCNNYVEIRNLFPNLLQKYYEKVVKEAIGNDDNLLCLLRENNIYIKVQNEEMTFFKFATEIMGSRSKEESFEYDKIVQAFGLQESEENYISISDFVIRYINFNKTRRGSMLVKISSILPTSGRQIDMIYPKNNAKHKYFAMSGNLAEFYVRLYLSEKNLKYDSLDSFLEHLQNKYRIVIEKPKAGDKILNNVKPKLSAQEFSKNRIAFLNTLDGANCLVKLSDSGYVITLPEEKGGFQLI